ncbi:MAG: BrnT family toxin [Mycobacterium sp.]|nr:BrnT family toxin [Mycobacterium sp.]
MLEFEFDPAKSVANRQKHGIDFSDAQALWRDSHRIEVPARTTDEPRWMVIGLVDGRVWSAVVTYRGDHVRIISVRPSRENEVALDEG